MNQKILMTQMTQEGGNTITPSLNIKKASRSRKYCFTLNNYTSEEYNLLLTQFTDDLYIFGEEIGEQGTPHIQGFIEFKNARSFSSVKKLIPRAHIEIARGSIKKNYLYCSKDGVFKTNIKSIITPRKIIDPLEGKTLRPFQQEIINMIKEEPDQRTVYWYWETLGNVGKTAICKHLCLTQQCLILNGKQNDMFNAIIQYKESIGDYPRIIIIDVPRCSIDYISWTAIEKIKDGLFYSGKYEGGMVIMNCPWVICMANSAPDQGKLSTDRWVIKCLDDSDIDELT